MSSSGGHFVSSATGWRCARRSFRRSPLGPLRRFSARIALRSLIVCFTVFATSSPLEFLPVFVA